MSSVYEAYKPFRNFVKKFDVINSLYFLWYYSQHLAGNKALPKGFLPIHAYGLKSSLRNLVFPWDLEVLCREFILSAGGAEKKRLDNWADFSKIINYVRDIENVASKESLKEESVLLVVNKLLHKQTPWQKPLNKATVLRYVRIYQDETIQRIFKDRLGVEWKKFFLIFIFLQKNFGDYCYIPKSVDLGSIGVSGTDIEAFLKIFCSDLNSLRKKMSEHHVVDLHWLYRFNPLIQTPLISLTKNGEEVLACPISDFLWNRVSQGVYFDLIDIPEYTQAYGRSFERYIGDVLKEALNSEAYTILKPEEYHVAGKNLKHGSDWIVYDSTANIFVETKTKQLRYGSKFLLNNEELLRDLNIASEAVVQNYKNILDAQKGKTNWEDNNLPIYSFIVTLEDWQIFSPIIHEKIDELVVEKMELLGIPTELMEVIPYLICSSEEFELFCCAARFHSFQDILHPYLSDTNYERWLLRSYLLKNYQKEVKTSFERWFEDDWLEIVPRKTSP